MTDTNKPDFKNPNREPVISVMDMARLDDTEVETLHLANRSTLTRVAGSRLWRA